MEYLGYQSENVALLLTDINMPGRINGADLAKVSKWLWPSIPVVVISDYETIKSTGIDQRTLFLRKPFTVDELLARTRTALLGYTSI